MKYFLRKCILLPTAIVLTVFSATACLGNDTVTAKTTTSTSTVSTTAQSSSIAEDITASYSEKDLDATWDDKAASHITFSEATISGDKQDGIAIEGSTLTISAAGTYVLSGTLNDGQIIIDAADTDDIHLVLQNVSISNSKTSPIYVKNADKTIVTLPEGTTSTISDAKEYTFAEGEDEPDAALFSNNDLTINGSGKLVVNGNYRNGVATKDDLVIISGVIEITAVNDALRGRDSVAVKDGKFILTAGGDGIKANQDADSTKGYIILDGGDYTITAENDGIQAESLLKINDGNYTITTGGGSVNAPVKTTQQMGRGGGGHGTPPTMDSTEMKEGTAVKDGTQGTPPERPQRGERTDAPPSDGTVPTDAPVPPDGAIPTDAPASRITVAGSTTEATTESTKGLKATIALVIKGGTFKLDTVDDALHSNGTVTIDNGNFAIATGDDGIHADSDLTINSGFIAISKSYEGIEGATVTVNGGEIQIVSSDDGMNAAGGNDVSTQDSFRSTGDYFIRITNGAITIDAGGDGIDSNGNFYQEGGDIVIQSTTNRGDSPLDYDGECSITGGTMSPAIDTQKNQA